MSALSTVTSSSTDPIYNTIILANFVNDVQGSPTTQYWLEITGLGGGANIYLDSNVQIGCANAGINNPTGATITNL